MKIKNKKHYKKSLIFFVFFLFLFLLNFNNTFAEGPITIKISTLGGGRPNSPVKDGDILFSTEGGAMEFKYETTGASMCDVPGPTLGGSSGGITAANGSFSIYNITKTKTYTLTCYGKPEHPYGSPNPPKISFTVAVVNNGSFSDVLTLPATNIKDTSADLSGSLNPGALGTPDSADVYFRYSSVSPEKLTPIFCNDIYGSDMYSSREIRVTDNKNVLVKTTITNLEPNTTYYYCVVASNKTIVYGGLKSFTTQPSEGVFSIKEKDALIISANSAYLNGFFNTTLPVKTWFEYRKVSVLKGEKQTASVLNKSTSRNLITLIQNFFRSFKTKEALAIVPENNWIKVGELAHGPDTSGEINYRLDGLTPATKYEFKVAIKINSTGAVYYSGINNFTTKGLSSITTGIPPIGTGTPYTNPCDNLDTDTNCNGTGGNGNGWGQLNNDGKPDLTAGEVSVSSNIVNTPMVIMATIKNQGDASTAYVPTDKNINNTNNTTQGTKGITSFLNKIFGVNKVFALTSTTNSITGTTTNSTKSSVGNFYNFFQVSTMDPNIVTKVNNSTEKTIPENSINNSLVNFPPILMNALDARSSGIMTQDYTFTSTGKYYIRACADKRSPSDKGLIQESYENNNCGPWSTITIGLAKTETGTNDGNQGSGNGNNNGNTTASPINLTLGQIATPPTDAIVRYHEGIETVLQRQIVKNTELAESYGYKTGDDLPAFAWQLSDFLAKKFGYIGKNNKEIRVSLPDIAAYQLYMNDGVLTIYEYYDSKIVNIQKITNALRNIYKYEYYFKKMANKVF